MINLKNKEISRGLKIFVIGNDKSIFDKNSRLFGRVVEYSQLVDKYKVIVPNNTKTRLDISEHLSIISFGGENKLLQIIKLFFGSIYILKKEKFDVISVQDQYFLGFIAFLLAKIFKIGIEIQIHGFEKYNGLRKFIANIVIPRANSIRVVSNRLKNEIIEKFKINQEKITVVPIYTNISEPVSQRVRELGEKFVFLTIGRLVKVKNIELQIKSLKSIIEKYNNIELHIVGNGPEKNNLEKLVKELNLENYVKFFGYQGNLEKFYQNCDVFLLTSNYEGWGLVIIEALQYKLPIIMTDVGCANEIIVNNENAMIIPVNDLSSLENAMIKIYEDYNLREKFIRNSEIAISKLKTKNETLDLYKKSWENAVLKN